LLIACNSCQSIRLT